VAEQVQLTGTVLGAPASTTDSTFPASAVNIPFTLNPPQKTFNVAAGGFPINLNSPAAFVAIPGIGGVVGPVTQAQLLYGRVSTPMRFRLTYLGDATPYVSYVGGIFIIEADPSSPITLFEVRGSGTLEFYATGVV